MFWKNSDDAEGKSPAKQSWTLQSNQSAKSPVKKQKSDFVKEHPKLSVPKNVAVRSDLSYAHPCRLAGYILGDIEAFDTLEIENSATVEGSISAAKDVSVSGCVLGNLAVAGKLTLKPDSMVDGNINCAVLEMAPGVQVNGKITTIRR